MFQISFLSGKMAGRSVEVRHFPFRLGRGASNDFVLEEPGVWQQHLELNCENNCCSVNALEGALVAVNGETVRCLALRNGDQVQIGAVIVRFGLAPVALRGLGVREAAIWTSLAVVFLFQFWLIYRLLG